MNVGCEGVNVFGKTNPTRLGPATEAIRLWRRLEASQPTAWPTTQGQRTNLTELIDRTGIISTPPDASAPTHQPM